MANKNLKLKLKLNLLNDSKYLYTISQIQGQHTENTELNRNTNYPMKKKWEEEMNRYFQEEDIQDSNRQMKMCSVTCIRGNAHQITMRYFTPVRMEYVKKTGNYQV